MALKPRQMRGLEAWHEDLVGYGYKKLELWDKALVLATAWFRLRDLLP